MKNVWFMVFALIATLFLSGCQLGKSGKTTTDWSLPSVKLPTAKKGDIQNPSSRANPKTTSELAHQRADGSNPTVAVSKDDKSLTPDPSEVAHLSQLEGETLPAWAKQAPPAENPAAPISSPSTPSSPLSPSASSASSASLAGADKPISAPKQAEMPAVGNTDLAGGLPPLSEPSAPSSALPDSLPPLGSTLPQTAAATTATPSPQMGNQPALGDSMSEFPGTSAPAPVANVATTPAPTPAQTPAPITPGTPVLSNVTPVSAQEPVTAKPATAEPAALFMPGNINPSYPGR